jgi:CHAT domain-containing protein
MVGDQIGRQALTLLHISAHGQRDVGSGSPVLWLGAHPLLSYTFADQPIADTIVINACESGAVPDFGLSQSSIASGFLHAGARQVVATLFPIGDVAAAKFSEKFYASYDPAKHNLANAVRDAQLALRDSRSNGLAWAAYVVLTSRD